MPRKASKTTKGQRAWANLADPALRRRLESAARHAGFGSPAEMLQAGIDGGVAHEIEERPDVTDEMSFERLGEVLARHLRMHPRAGQYDFAASLTETQRNALIVQLRREGQSSPTVASALGISRQEIDEVYRKFRDAVGDAVIGVKLSSILGELQNRYEMTVEALTEKGDHKGAFQITKEFIKLLQDTEIVQRAAARVEHMHERTATDDEKERMIEELLDERKAIEESRREYEALQIEVKDAEVE